ncbi:uncharacterized protein ACIBXB_017550 [Morphnus guianensis]
MLQNIFARTQTSQLHPQSSAPCQHVTQEVPVHSLRSNVLKIGINTESYSVRRDVPLLPAQGDLNRLKEMQSKSLNTFVVGEAARDISGPKIMLLSNTAVSISALFLVVPKMNLREE